MTLRTVREQSADPNLQSYTLSAAIGAALGDSAICAPPQRGAAKAAETLDPEPYDHPIHARLIAWRTGDQSLSHTTNAFDASIPQNKWVPASDPSSPT